MFGSIPLATPSIRYTGQWHQGKEHGLGEFRDTERGESYLGEWRGGQRDGFGKAHFTTGDTYEGDWSPEAASSPLVLVFESGTLPPKVDARITKAWLFRHFDRQCKGRD